MYLFDLGERPWEQSMLIFHALARMGIEAIDIVWPQTPFISIGYFQDAKKEVDLEYCKRMGLPIIRREVGGGTVYLDRNQIFYHMVWNKDNIISTGIVFLHIRCFQLITHIPTHAFMG